MTRKTTLFTKPVVKRDLRLFFWEKRETKLLVSMIIIDSKHFRRMVHVCMYQKLKLK